MLGTLDFTVSEQWAHKQVKGRIQDHNNLSLRGLMLRLSIGLACQSGSCCIPQDPRHHPVG